MHPYSHTLCIDKLELSYRLGENNITPVFIVQDVMRYYVDNGLATYRKPKRYANNRFPSHRCVVPLQGFSRQTLFIECGVAYDRNQIQWPYLKFGYNVDRLSCDEAARLSFHEVMNDFLIGAGYGELLAQGNVLYAEFAYDVRGIDIATIDAYSPRMQQGEWISPNERLETIYLYDGRVKRQEEFCAYNKKLSDRKRRHHIHRGPLARIEARRRFNNSEKYRTITLAELGGIENPFETLLILDRAKLEQTFTARRHANFLSKLSRHGIQSAFEGTTGADHERRLRMLDECKVDWWNPQTAWAGVDTAISAASLVLEREIELSGVNSSARNPRAPQ